MTGGGVYVETPNPKPNSLKMYNALITGNTASVMGGGMYFCPTGTAELYIDQGAGTLGDHGIECFARGLQYPFKDSLKENTE